MEAIMENVNDYRGVWLCEGKRCSHTIETWFSEFMSWPTDKNGYRIAPSCPVHGTKAAELKPASTNQMIDSVQATYNKCLATMERKCSDYAGLATPYKNFETVERLGVSTTVGIFIRLLDKITRLENLLKIDATKPFVTEETVEDTIEYAINYLAILKARREKERTA